MSKKHPFSQLKKAWGLAEETSAEELLVHAKKKLDADPKNPELTFNLAEILRHLENTQEATKAYKEAIQKTDLKTDSRLQALNTRVNQERTDLRNRFLLLVFAPVITSIFLGIFIWQKITEPEVLPADSNPEQFAFTEWLAKQQMSQMMSNLQEQNPELTFDFSSSATAQSPLEFMQSLLESNALDSLRKEQTPSDGDENNQDSQPAFQCSTEPPPFNVVKNLLLCVMPMMSLAHQVMLERKSFH